MGSFVLFIGREVKTIPSMLKASPLHSSSDSSQHLARYQFAKTYTAGKVVLDVACGDGYGSKILAENAQKVVGADNDKHLLELAKNSRITGGNLEFCFCDARHLPFPENSFDVSVSTETIEHFIEQKIFVNELKRVTRRGGIIIISTPDRSANEKMGTYHDRHREGHGHPGEMRFAQFFYLMNGSLSQIEFYGQLFLKQEPTLQHKLINLVKRVDIFKFRRLFSKSVRDKYNLSLGLMNEDCTVRKLDGQAVDVIAVGINEK